VSRPGFPGWLPSWPAADLIPDGPVRAMLFKSKTVYHEAHEKHKGRKHKSNFWFCFVLFVFFVVEILFKVTIWRHGPTRWG
jgi:hypothetical protein